MEVTKEKAILYLVLMLVIGEPQGNEVTGNIEI